MTTLSDSLLKPETRPQLIRDCAQVLDQEVASKGGISGLAIKASYKIVKSLKPGMVTELIDGLIDDMVGNLEPLWADFQKTGGPSFEAFAVSQRGPVADALLKVTDDRAAKSSHGTLKGAYGKLRPTGKKNVEDAVPRLSAMVAKHMK